MSVVIEHPPLWQRLRPAFEGFDGGLALAVALLMTGAMLVMYSVGYDNGNRFYDHGRNMLIALGVMFVIAQIPLSRLSRLAVPLYSLGVLLLVAVALFGITKKGATRWINVGVVIQPSEIMKIAMPLMLAWWFQRREGTLATSCSPSTPSCSPPSSSAWWRCARASPGCRSCSAWRC